VIKSFLTLVKKLNADNKKPEKINYKQIQKKYAKPKTINIFKKKKN